MALRHHHTITRSPHRLLLFVPNNLLLPPPSRYSLDRFGVLELVAAGKNRNKAAHGFGQEEEEAQ